MLKDLDSRCFTEAAEVLSNFAQVLTLYFRIVTKIVARQLACHTHNGKTLTA